MEGLTEEQWEKIREHRRILEERLATEPRRDVPVYKKDALQKFIGFLNATKLTGAALKAAVIGPSYYAKLKVNMSESDRATFANETIVGVKIVVCEALEGNECFLFGSLSEAEHMKNQLLLAKASGIAIDRWLYWKGYQTLTV